MAYSSILMMEAVPSFETSTTIHDVTLNDNTSFGLCTSTWGWGPQTSLFTSRDSQTEYGNNWVSGFVQCVTDTQIQYVLLCLSTELALITVYRQQHWIIQEYQHSTNRVFKFTLTIIMWTPQYRIRSVGKRFYWLREGNCYCVFRHLPGRLQARVQTAEKIRHFCLYYLVFILYICQLSFYVKF